MNTIVKHLRQLGQKAITVGRYLHGDSLGEQEARRYDIVTGKGRSSGRRLHVKRGPDEFSAEPRDPLETSILGGDRDEYIDKSFWHDAEARGVTFEESRVDGIWDEDGEEMWK
jgi:hypothetical protein